MAKRLKEIDETLHLRWNERGEYFVVYQIVGGRLDEGAEEKLVLTAKELTDEDKKQLNGSVAAVFDRKSLAGPELIGWLHQLVGT